MSKAILVQIKGKKIQNGYVYYKKNDDLKQEKVKVNLVDDNMIETGENLLCSPKNLTAIGFKD